MLERIKNRKEKLEITVQQIRLNIEKIITYFIFTTEKAPLKWREWAGDQFCHYCWKKFKVEVRTYSAMIKNDRWIRWCSDCENQVDRGPVGWTADSITKEGKRASHWRDIQTRVRTHEGQLLTGKKGVDYQNKWSKQMLGKDLGASSRADRFMVDNFQRQQNAKRN